MLQKSRLQESICGTIQFIYSLRTHQTLLYIVYNPYIWSKSRNAWGKPTAYSAQQVGEKGTEESISIVFTDSWYVDVLYITLYTLLYA